jgi:hypothetical protein
VGAETNSRVIQITNFSPQSVTTKFARVKQEITVFRKTGMHDPSHDELIMHGSQQIAHLRRVDPAQLDAGHLQFLPNFRVIRIFDVSNTLGYPLPTYTRSAREITARTLLQVFPDYDIHYADNMPSLGKLLVGDSGEESHFGIGG